uniref:Glyoxylate reductase/hydroxypyruvate reductase n=1 Tax=Hirondellea gigas TaxID=1518452 RepID=A0A6A7G7I2_9CRUS
MSFRVLVTVPLPTKARSLLERSGAEIVYPSRFHALGDENSAAFVLEAGLKTEEALAILKREKPVDAIFTTLICKINKEILDTAGPQLKVVSTVSVGYDHISLDECWTRGILVGHTPGVLSDSTADMAITLCLAAGRRIPEARQAVLDGSWGDWRPLWMCGMDLHHATVGIVGLGRIGQIVAKRLKAFDCNLIYSDVIRNEAAEKEFGLHYVDFDDLLQRADFVLPHIPLLPETRKLFNLKTFKKMKKSAIFVNTSRGPVCDMDDLYTALKTGEIAAAGLDVTDPEPLPPSHPLLTLPNCLIVPHVASASIRTRLDMFDLAVRNTIAAINGKPLPSEVKPPSAKSKL